MNKKDIFLAIIAKHIYAKRKELGHTQDELACIADIDSKHFGKIERGKKLPNAHTFAKIEMALDLDKSYLIEYQTTIEQLKKEK